MPDQIPEQCAPLQSRVDSLTFQWHQLQEELEGADPSDRTRISNLVGAKERELKIAEDSLADCIANASAPPPHRHHLHLRHRRHQTLYQYRMYVFLIGTPLSSTLHLPNHLYTHF